MGDSGGVEGAVAMLQGATSDTGKFAALMAVTKLVKSSELQEEDKKVLLEAIGLQFLVRMLRTDAAPPGCPPFMFKSLSLTILTSFLSVCPRGPLLFSTVGILADIISNPEKYEEDLTIVKEAYEVLTLIAGDEKGCKAIINHESIGPLVDAYTSETLGSDSALEILLAVIRSEGSETWVDEPETLDRLMVHLVTDMVIDDSEKKFDLCVSVGEALNSLPMSYAIQQSEWAGMLHKGLSDVTMSKLSAEHRIKSLQLMAAALANLGAHWVVNKGDGGQQLLLLMVHLACVEVRLSLEEKSVQEALAQANPTTACYSILENAISYMISNDSLELEQKQKQQLYSALKGAFHAVLTFLKQVPENSISYEESPKVQLFVCATIRVLGAWLAEETAAHKKEVYKLLPFLVRTARFNFDHNRSLLTTKKKKKKGSATEPSKEKMQDIFKFLLPALCHLTAEDGSRRILLDNDLEKFLMEYMMMHWEAVQVAFSKQQDMAKIEKNESVVSSRTTIITCCNIYMNIVVQEANRVKKSNFYYTLLKFLFSHVPSVPLNQKFLSLIGNLCTLGLMILRHQTHNVKSTDVSIFRFIQFTVRFLWDAHNVDDSPDLSTLVVSTAYISEWEDLRELWFLSLQTLSILLPTLPWICEFLAESNWPQTVVANLNCVLAENLEISLKTAYEDFLVHLIYASSDAAKQLKEKGLEVACRVHRMEDLQMALSRC